MYHKGVWAFVVGIGTVGLILWAIDMFYQEVWPYISRQVLNLFKTGGSPLQVVDWKAEGDHETKRELLHISKISLIALAIETKNNVNIKYVIEGTVFELDATFEELAEQGINIKELIRLSTTAKQVV